MHNQLKSNDFLLKVTYLGDFFSEENFLNLTPQGGRQWLHTTHDKVAAFKRKVELYKRLTEKGTTCMFPDLTMLLQSDPNMKCNFTQEIVSHLNATKLQLIDIFLELKSDIIFYGLASHSQLKKTLYGMIIWQQKLSFFNCAKIQVLRLALQRI